MTVQKAFEIVEMRDGKPGCSLDEFRELVVASLQEDWEEQIDEDSNRPYYVNVKTGESSWEDADDTYAEQFFELSGIVKFNAV